MVPITGLCFQISIDWVERYWRDRLGPAQQPETRGGETEGDLDSLVAWYPVTPIRMKFAIDKKSNNFTAACIRQWLCSGGTGIGFWCRIERRLRWNEMASAPDSKPRDSSQWKPGVEERGTHSGDEAVFNWMSVLQPCASMEGRSPRLSDPLPCPHTL